MLGVESWPREAIERLITFLSEQAIQQEMEEIEDGWS
jgi:hypothetical protein